MGTLTGFPRPPALEAAGQSPSASTRCAIIRTMSQGWQERYAHMVLPRDQAIAKIQRGARIFVGSGCAQPQYLVQGLANHPSAVADSEILHMLTLGSAPYTDERLQRVFRHNAFFIGDNTRAAVAEGRADYTPVFLSELPGMFRSG